MCTCFVVCARISFPSLEARIGKLTVACRFPTYLPCDTQHIAHWFQLFPSWPTRSQETLERASCLERETRYFLSAISAEPVQVAFKDVWEVCTEVRLGYPVLFTRFLCTTGMSKPAACLLDWSFLWLEFSICIFCFYEYNVNDWICPNHFGFTFFWHKLVTSLWNKSPLFVFVGRSFPL